MITEPRTNQLTTYATDAVRAEVDEAATALNKSRAAWLHDAAVEKLSRQHGRSKARQPS